MADDWIKIRVDLADDPNVFIMSDHLSIDVPTVVGHLVMFWGWMDRHTPDGVSLKLSDSVIDKRMSVPGFASALRLVGWLEGDDWSLVIPNFERHNGNSAKARALEAEAKRLRRQQKSLNQETAPPPQKPPATPVRQVSDKNPLKSPTREEKRREDISTTSSTATGTDHAVSDTRPTFAMTLGWQPESEQMHDRIMMAGINPDHIPPDRQQALLGEFRSYWATRPDQHTEAQWQHKLLQAIQRAKANGYQADGAGASPRAGNKTRNRSLETDLMDRSWAE